MNLKKMLSLVALLGLPLAVQANYLSLRSDVLSDHPQITVLRSDENLIQIEVRIPGVELSGETREGRRWDRVEIPGGGLNGERGAPEVPSFSTLLAIPATAGVRAEFEELESRIIPNLELWPAQGLDPADLEQNRPWEYNQTTYRRNAFYPEQRVKWSEPALMRGLRLVTISANPVQYNPVTKELRVVHRYRITLHFEGSDPRNVSTREIPLSRTWTTMMRAMVANFDELSLDDPSPEAAMGPYLIVCENNASLINLLQPLVDWKTRKGHSVTIQTFAEGASNTTIKGVIQTAYDTWLVPPEYVLLVGDTGGDFTLPGWTVQFFEQIDHPYAQVEGGDILADVALGRFPAENSTQVTTMCNKILYYEKIPYTTNSDWYHQSVLCAGSGSGFSPVQVNRYIKTRMVWNNFTRIDTMWYTMGGSIPTTISTAINNGVTYFNYRGYIGVSGWDNSDIDALSNGRKLPFCSTITCETGGFSGWFGESTMEHFFKVGTPSTPKGAVAAVGTATSTTNTRCNNTVNMGLYAGLFDEGITQVGNALNRGKLELYAAYQANDPGNVDNFSLWNALAGDPGTELFTGAIQYLACTVPDSLSWGQNSLTLTVSESGVGPLEGATVCLYKSGAGGTQEVGFTDLNGQVTLPLSVSAAGNVKVSITKQNFYPIVDSLEVVQMPVAVGYFSHTVDDDNLGGSSGDGDGVINPGEVVQILLVFKNYGSTTTATNVSVTASEADPYVTLSNATQTFPNLAPGATGNSSGSFLLTVASNCPPGHIITLNLVTASAQGSWNGLMELSTASYDMNLISAVASGGDTLLSPGETANLILTVRNVGGKTAAALTANLVSLDAYITVHDNQANFGTVNVNAVASCSGNPFNLTATNNAPPGHLADLKVTFTSATGATQVDTITLSLGNKTPADPQGPDEYGYYCYDNTDLNYGPAPTYSWVEIDPRSGGSGTITSLSDPGEDLDASLNVTLPFTFRYYGENVTQVTVCSNGWISTWPNVSFTDFRNYPIPSACGPNGKIAPFWDDLTTVGEGRVCTWNDAANHRFLVEWSRTPPLAATGTPETFEVILYDPAYYPTPTGDGRILFQYNTIQEVYGYGADNPYSTIGIERPDQQDGIQVVYWNTYTDPAATPVVNGRAYLFTTEFSYTQPGGNLYVNLTPFGAPIVIPPTGGSFNFNIAVGNSSTTPSSGDVWCMITLPSGASYGPVLGPVLGLSFPGNWTTNRNRTQNVPASAPAGSYTYRGFIGSYPVTVYDEASFPFSKSGDDGSGDWFSGWSNTGDSFDDLFETSTALPEQNALLPAYPNPFNPTTVASYELRVASQVHLSVYDVSGRLVATLVNGWLEAGEHAINFDASELASGIYLLSLQAGDYQAVQKVVLLK